MSKIWSGFNPTKTDEPLSLILEQFENCPIVQRKEKLDETFQSMAKIAISGLNDFNQENTRKEYFNLLVNLACQDSFRTIAYGKKHNMEVAKNVYDNLQVMATTIVDSNLLENLRDNNLGFLSEFAVLGTFWSAVIHNFLSDRSYALLTDKKRDMSSRGKIKKDGFDILAKTGNRTKATHFIQVKASPNPKNWPKYEPKIKIISPSLISKNTQIFVDDCTQHPTAGIIRTIANNDRSKLMVFAQNLSEFLRYK